jgi:ABC-2 type transport system permease protein
MCLAVLLVGADELSTVSFSVIELSRFPVQAYRQPLQTLLVVVPVALLTTVPAQALLGRLDPIWLIASPLAATAALVAASVGWHRVLRRYTGASA